MTNSKGGQTKKPVIGIIGGIGSGKSTVAVEFGRLGCAVIHADRIAHQVLNRPDVRQRVIEAFGQEVEGQDGQINRQRLAQIVFSDPAKLAELNRMVHPTVLKEVEALMEFFQDYTDVPAIVLDIPLLLEVGWKDRCDRLVFVACDPVRRAERNRLLGPDQIAAREKFQIPLDSKAAAADNIIDNNSDFSTLARQVATIFADVLKHHRDLQSQE
ncbi:MAG: dephospho-CoA kinase [Sedimentisphaerales bacterium]|jgi:dephospho-CoA kinase|nr:dephospho-CoA kinase [Sedimentisphaerales bacterium]